MTLKRPQARGAGPPFPFRLVPPHTTRLKEREEAIPLLSLHGLSPRRIRKALGTLRGTRGLSTTPVIRRGVRGGTREKEAVLVAHAILADGRREVRAGALGSRESTRAWTDRLEDLQRHGVRAPLVLIPEGGPGVLAAVEACFPDVPRQHCTQPKRAPILEKVPKGVHAEVGDVARRVLDAPTREQAEEALALLERASRKGFPSAVEGWPRDLEACWTSYRFPVSPWTRIRTTNVLERSFREVRRRVREVGRFPDELRALALVHAVRQEASAGWQRLGMTSEAQRLRATMRVQQQTQAAEKTTHVNP